MEPMQTALITSAIELVDSQLMAELSTRVGCWYDSHQGRYIGTGVIAEAIAYGWNETAAGYEKDGPDADHADYMEAWDDADRFLANLAPAGYWIGSNENGDFGMWSIEDEDSEDDD